MARYKYRRTYTWSADIAYIVGLIASDGCLSKDGRHLIITSKDIEIIESFKSILSITANPRIKTGGYGTDAFDLQWGDVVFYDFLLAVGLTPAKSLTIGELDIPDEFYGDFLRGHFDGDGTVYGYRDVRWRSSYIFYVGFYSASLPFLVWLQKSNARLLGTLKGKIKRSNNVYVLNYAKADSRSLFEGMYSDTTIYKLTRKYTKFVAFLGVNPYAK